MALAAAQPAYDPVPVGRPGRARAIALNGRTCSGKSSVASALIAQTGAYTRVRTVTTRRPRHRERFESDHRFVSKQEFFRLSMGEQMIEETMRGDHYYGICAEDMVEALAQPGKTALLAIDSNGIASLSSASKRMSFDLYTVYLATPVDQCLDRLKGRYELDLANADIGAVDALRDTYLERIIDTVLGEWLDEDACRARCDMSVHNEDRSDGPDVAFIHGEIAEKFNVATARPKPWRPVVEGEFVSIGSQHAYLLEKAERAIDNHSRPWSEQLADYCDSQYSSPYP